LILPCASLTFQFICFPCLPKDLIPFRQTLRWNQFWMINSHVKRESISPSSSYDPFYNPRARVVVDSDSPHITHKYSYLTNLQSSCYSVFAWKYRPQIVSLVLALSTAIFFLVTMTNNQSTLLSWLFLFIPVPIVSIIRVGLEYSDVVAKLRPKSGVTCPWSAKKYFVFLAFVLDFLQGVSSPLLFYFFSDVCMNYLSYMKQWQLACFFILLSLYWLTACLPYHLFLLNIALIVCFIFSCFLECVVFSVWYFLLAHLCRCKN